MLLLSSTFEQNPFILSVFLAGFHFSLAFMCSVHQMLKYFCQVCQPCTLLITCKQICVIPPLIVKNTFSSSRRSYTCANTLTRDNHRTAVWSNKTLCYAPISTPRCNYGLFSGLSLTKFIIRTTSSSTGAMSGGKVLAMSASRCKKECIKITLGCLSFTRLTNPSVHRTMAAAPSVQTLMQSSHIYLPCSRYSDVTRNISSPVVFSGNALQNRKFSLMVSQSTKRTLAKS